MTVMIVAAVLIVLGALCAEAVRASCRRALMTPVRTPMREPAAPAAMPVSAVSEQVA